MPKDVTLTVVIRKKLVGSTSLKRIKKLLGVADFLGKSEKFALHSSCLWIIKVKAISRGGSLAVDLSRKVGDDPGRADVIRRFTEGG